MFFKKEEKERIFCLFFLYGYIYLFINNKSDFFKSINVNKYSYTKNTIGWQHEHNVGSNH